MGRGATEPTELPDISRVGLRTENPLPSVPAGSRKRKPKRILCDSLAHELFGTDTKPDPEYDYASVKVTITSPPGAVKENKPVIYCTHCAAIEIKAYIEFGWFANAEPLS